MVVTGLPNSILEVKHRLILEELLINFKKQYNEKDPGEEEEHNWKKGRAQFPKHHRKTLNNTKVAEKITESSQEKNK